MKLVLYVILAYFAYLFIFKLVIPVYLASRKIKKGFREMQDRMQQQQSNQQPGFQEQQRSAPKPAPKTKAGDYIDFEEVK